MMYIIVPVYVAIFFGLIIYGTNQLWHATADIFAQDDEIRGHYIRCALGFFFAFLMIYVPYVVNNIWAH